MANTIKANNVRPGMVLRWFNGIDDTLTVERVTSDYRQRALRVHTFHMSDGTAIECLDDGVSYLP